MNRSYVEAFFRHKFLLCLPIALGLVVGSALAFRVEREYLANASFWADAPVTEASTNGTTGGASPPAAGESTLLMQMLATRAFMRSVVQASPLAEDYAAAAPVEADQMLGTVASTIAVTVSGPQLVGVTVTRTDPVEATGLAQAVLSEFEQAKIDLSVNRAKSALNYQRRVLEAAEDAAENSNDRETTQRLADARAAFDTANVAVVNAESSGLQIVDHPDLALPQARMKTIAFGGIGGMMAGLTVSLMALILTMARDRSIRNERAATALGFDVIGSVPNVKWKRRSRSEQKATKDRQPVSIGS